MLAQSIKHISLDNPLPNVESNLVFRIRFVSLFKETVSLVQWRQKNFHFTVYHPPPSLPRQNKLKYWQHVTLRRISFNSV